MHKEIKRRRWTTLELRYLADVAGRVSLEEICFTLDRSTESIRAQASKMNLSLRHYEANLVWCIECASWRSDIDMRTGKCRVCTKRDNLAGREAACAETMALMTSRQRRIYEESETLRSTRKLLIRPLKNVCGTSRYEQDKAEAEYLLALEEWEWRMLHLQYNAAKTRLRRMRKITGTNPRRSKQQKSQPETSKRRPA